MSISGGKWKESGARWNLSVTALTPVYPCNLNIRHAGRWIENVMNKKKTEEMADKVCMLIVQEDTEGDQGLSMRAFYTKENAHVLAYACMAFLKGSLKPKEFIRLFTGCQKDVAGTTLNYDKAEEFLEQLGIKLWRDSRNF